MDTWSLLFIAVAGLVSGILSGIGGGGAGMLMIPAFILTGMSPLNAVATGKMNGLGANFGGLMAFRNGSHFRKDIVRVMIPIAILVGVTTPFVFNRIESSTFQVILGVLLLLLTPTLFVKKKLSGLQQSHRIIGYIAYTFVITLQALFGTGVGTLAIFVLTLLFGTSKLQANATKRAVSAILVPITFVALLFSGYVILSFGIVGMVSVFVGSNIGTKLAIKGGEQFATYAMAVIMPLAAIFLITTA